MNRFVATMTAASIVVGVSSAHAGLFDSLSKGIQETAKGLDALGVKGVQPPASSQGESRDVSGVGGKTENQGRDGRKGNKVQDSRQRTAVTDAGQDRQAEALRKRGVIPAGEVESANKLLLNEIDQFLNGEFSKDVVATFPGQRKDQVLKPIIGYANDKDRTLGTVSLCRSGAPSAGFRDANGAVEGLGLELQIRCYDAKEAKRISKAWIEHAKTWLALNKATVPMREFLNGDFKRRLQDVEKSRLLLNDKYTARFLGEQPEGALSEYAQELNRKFDPNWTVFGNSDSGNSFAVSCGGLWLNSNITDPKVIADGIVSWKQKFDELMKPVEEQIAAALKGAADDERAFTAFVQSVGQQASGSTNAFVGVEVYKGIRLGMTEIDFHKIVPSPCSDAHWDAENRFGKPLCYPSIKKNTIAPSGGSIGAINVYLGGPDLKEVFDESQKNFMVTRVVFTINNAASTPGIEAVEKQFAKRFGKDVRVERSVREMPRGFSDAAGHDPKVQAIYAKMKKYEKQAENYKLTGTMPPQKFIEDVKAAQEELKVATAQYAIVEKYPVIRLSCAGQIVVLTQPDLTRNVEVTAFYEEAESQLSSLRLSLMDKALKKQAEKQEKAALDF